MNRLVLLLAVSAFALFARPAVGPARGSLVICGGGRLGSEILNEFIALAGGPDAPIVIIPTASESEQIPADHLEKSALAKAGARNLILLHTRDRKVADSAGFVAPLRKARGVWFDG